LKRLDLVIDSELGNVSLLAVAVNRVCLQLGFDSLTAAHLELCVAEAVTNSICHAYHRVRGHTVKVTLAADAGRLHVEVSDTGTPMGAEHQQRLTRESSDSEIQTYDWRSLPEGGRGLKIIRDLMDEVSYVSSENVNRLMMVKQLTPNGSRIDRDEHAG